MKLKALIVDDEYSGRTAIEILLRKNYQHLFAKVELAKNLGEAKTKIEEDNFDICFLDIQLGNNSGFELLPFMNEETEIIFITAYSEYAIRAIKERAFDYILKPIDPIEFKECIARYENEFSETKDLKEHLLIKVQGETNPIQIFNIEYLEADGPYSIIHLVNKKRITTSKTLKVISGTLGDNFVRIHKSYLVNKAFIKSFKKETLKTIYDTCLPVSRLGTKELSRHF